jgi:hypothetical protein
VSQGLKMATIECATCSTLIEVFPTALSEGPDVEWARLEDDHCKAPPLARCPYARSEIKDRFPGINF